MTKATTLGLWIAVISISSRLSMTQESIADDNTNALCESPYRPVGPDNYCLFIDNRIEGTWDEMRQFCKQFQGDLAFFDDANLLHDVVHYVLETGLNDSSFWIGSQDQMTEGDWVWAWNYKSVRMNTPLWGTTAGSQEPRGGIGQNCGFLNINKFYFMDDTECDRLHGVICDPLTNKQHQGDGEQNSSTHVTDASGVCPVPFQMIGESCLLVDSISENTWDFGKILCEGLGGHLAKLDDANVMGYLYDLFTNQSIRTNFWLGGSDGEDEGNWFWLDGTSVCLETPFWGLNFWGHQEPKGGTNENCLALDHQNFYFFNDMNCNNTGGIICQYDMA